MTLVAGVDCSTQSTKVEIREAESGRRVGSGRSAHPPAVPPRSEQPPRAWWDAFESAWAAALTEASARPGEIAAISVAGQQHGLVALDANDEPLRPAKLWNDTESAPDAGWLIAQLGDPAAWAKRCGSVPVAAFTITKLSWLHRSEPDVWARLARVCLPHDWLTLRLTGEFVTDRGDASGTGYWSPTSGEYDLDVLHIVDAANDWLSMLPRVAAPDETVGCWNGTAVACGTGDNMAAALGLGLERGDAAISIGTSGTVFTVSDSPTADASGAVAGFADATGAFLPLVCTSNGSRVIDTMAALVGRGLDEFDHLAGLGLADCPDLVLVPYLDGERTPNRPTATGELVGLRTTTTPEHVAAATIIGVVCGLLDGLDALGRHAPVSDGRLLLTGGGARFASVRRALASLTGRPVEVADLNESVAAGACVQAAAIALGEPHRVVRAGWSIGTASVTDPDPAVDAAELRARYAAARDRPGAA